MITLDFISGSIIEKRMHTPHEDDMRDPDYTERESPHVYRIYKVY